MRRAFLTAVAAAIAAASGMASAHEGHQHKYMGKVLSVQEKEIQIETTDGKKVTGVLGPETRYLRGKAAVAVTDVKVGERVVIVVVEEKKVQKVKRVFLGGGTAGAAREHKE